MAGLILASGSPRRKELLAMLDMDFTVVVPEVDENIINAGTPGKKGELVALAKARWAGDGHPGEVVLAADTMVVLDTGRILGKPRDEKDAIHMLRALSGCSHNVITGVAILRGQTEFETAFHVSTKVVFRDLTAGEIENYAATGEPLDKAGAYGIQGKGSLLVEKIEGCYFNVVGLPLPRLAVKLKDFGITLL